MAADPLSIEGLAAQLYLVDTQISGTYFVWWHLLRKDIKEKYRGIAAQKISDYHRNNDIPPYTPYTLGNTT